MKNDKALRKHLLYLLQEGGAHLDFDTAVKDMPFKLQGQKPKGGEHSPWQLLEHLRIALWDIVEFSRDPKHVSPEFPSGYWPKTQAPTDEKAWNKSARAYRTHFKGLTQLVANDKVDYVVYNKGEALANVLATQSDWELVYQDKVAVIYVPKS